MKFASPLIEGTFLKRYKRFFADVKIGNEIVVAHVPNTGSLKSCNEPGSQCLVAPATNPERKLRFTLEMIAVGKGNWVGVDTSIPNQIMRETLTDLVGKNMNGDSAFARWSHFSAFKPEYKLNAQTRLDFALGDEKTMNHFIEVKNVTLKEGTIALFPDAVTERGQKHLRELMELVHRGFSAEIVFVIQRSDVQSFAPAKSIDPEYAQLLRQAFEAGVFITPLRTELSPVGVRLLSEPLPIDWA